MLKLLKKYLKGYGFITVLGPLFKFFEAVIELFIPRLVANIVNVGIKNSDTAYVWKNSMFMLGLYVIAFFCSGICQYFAAKSAYGFGTNLRRGLFHHINRLPLSGIDHFQTSTLVMRINLDVVNTQNALNRFIRLITRAPFMLIGALVMAVIINPTLSLAFFGAALLLTAALFLVMTKSAPRLRKINLSHDHITLLSRENLSGARVVRAFGKQADEEADFKRASDLLKRQSIGLNLISALSSPLTFLIVNMAAVFIVYIGAFKVDSGTIDQGEIIALTNYLTYILNAMLVLAILVTLLTKATASARRINDVFAYPVEDLTGDELALDNLSDEGQTLGNNVSDNNLLNNCENTSGSCGDGGGDENTRKPKENIGNACAVDGDKISGEYKELLNNSENIHNVGGGDDSSKKPKEKTSDACDACACVFENVSMAYKGNAGYSLKNISFSLKKGGTLGIIGSTGSGKTTLISLITKLYDYEGRIEFFGRDLSKLSAVAVRSAVSVAPQKAVLFTGTVRDNLLMSNPSATDEEIAEALSAAQCGFLRSHGAVVSREGQNFSGGQRQRLSIARAIIKKPRLLILDDATSALDYSTEAEVKRALRSLTGLTKIIVSQRAISIKNADQIVVLENGEAVGVGTHASLYDTCPVYREIVDIQGVTL